MPASTTQGPFCLSATGGGSPATPIAASTFVHAGSSKLVDGVIQVTQTEGGQMGLASSPISVGADDTFAVMFQMVRASPPC